MSSYYGGGLNEWLEDSFFVSDIAPDKWAAIKAIMEPHRKSIAIALEGFEEDEYSWRDFRNSLWYSYEAESAKIQAVLKGELHPDDVLAPLSVSAAEYGALVTGAA